MSLSVEKIRKFTTSNKKAQTILVALSNRERIRKVTDLQQFRYKLNNEGENFSKEDILSLFSKLQEAGAGILIIGRKGKPTRFQWLYSMKDIANSVLSKNESNNLNKLKLDIPKKGQETKNVNSQSSQDDSKIKKTKNKIKKAKVELNKVAPSNSGNIFAYSFFKLKISKNRNIEIKMPFNLEKEDLYILKEFLKNFIEEDLHLEKEGNKKIEKDSETNLKTKSEEKEPENFQEKTSQLKVILRKAKDSIEEKQPAAKLE